MAPLKEEIKLITNANLEMDFKLKEMYPELRIRSDIAPGVIVHIKDEKVKLMPLFMYSNCVSDGKMTAMYKMAGSPGEEGLFIGLDGCGNVIEDDLIFESRYLAAKELPMDLEEINNEFSGIGFDVDPEFFTIEPLLKLGLTGERGRLYYYGVRSEEPLSAEQKSEFLSVLDKLMEEVGDGGDYKLSWGNTS